MSSARRAGLPLLRWAAALTYTAALFTMGLMDLGPLPVSPELPADKLGHLAAFGVYVWMLELALLDRTPGVRRALAVAASCSAGLLLELVQAALPHRSAEVGDFVADVLGALLAAAISFGVSRVFPRSAATARET